MTNASSTAQSVNSQNSISATTPSATLGTTPATTLGTTSAARTLRSTSNAQVVVGATSSPLAFPSDFPPGGKTGTTQRFAEVASDAAVGSALVVKPIGFGGSSGKTITFMRADGSALVAFYYPVGTAVQTHSVYVTFGENVAVPLASGFSDDGSWSDTPAGSTATHMVSSYFMNPTRVALLDLNGDGKTTATAAPTAAPVGKNNCVRFSSNPMCTPLPSKKALASSSGAWTSLLFQSGRGYFQHIEVTSDPNDKDNGSEPVFPLDGSTASVRNVIACDKTSWSQYVCGGKSADGTMQLPTDLVPASNSDHHASIGDTFRNGEQDFWLASAPAARGATIHVGGAGFCSWAGDGTNCSGSTATNIATSLGGIDPGDVQRAEATSSGVLPYAVGVSVLCADPSYVFPATASDGTNTNGSSACSGHTASGQRPPEGSRAFIDKSDADINATSNAPYVKVILRTMDRDHLGMTVTDTNWSGAPGLAPQYRTARSAAWAFALREARLPTSGTQWLPITNSGINMQTDIKFCSNGSC